MNRVLMLNGEEKTFSGDAQTPLLWVLREHFHLTGTKYGCGIASCGACTVHVEKCEKGISEGARAIRSCVTPIKQVSREQGQHVETLVQITTIEGLADSPSRLHDVQKAWVKERVPQCGYCQSGQIMSAVALLEALKSNQCALDDDRINQAMGGNLCRCGTYPRIRRAIYTAARAMGVRRGMRCEQ